MKIIYVFLSFLLLFSVNSQLTVLASCNSCCSGSNSCQSLLKYDFLRKNINMPREKCRLYSFDYNGSTYYVMKKSPDGSYSYKSFLGCSDSPTTYAEPLVDIIRDDSLTISSCDLKSKGIRFVKQNSDGTLDINNKSSDLSVSKVSSIPLHSIAYTLGSKTKGTVDMIIKPESSLRPSIKVKINLTKSSAEEAEELINKSLRRNKEKQFYKSSIQ